MVTQYKGIMPPTKPEYCTLMDFKDSHNWLMKNIQNSWWKNDHAQFPLNSEHILANFGTKWYFFIFCSD